VFLLRADGMPRPSVWSCWRRRVRYWVGNGESWRTNSVCRTRAELAGSAGGTTDADAARAGAAIPDVEAPPITHANGLGGFTAGGREYAIVLQGDMDTPQPWVNVIANERFGTVVGANGRRMDWAGNSRENRLTRSATTR